MSVARISGKKFRIHKSISAIADNYDGFILDQYGVMHDGTEPLNHASECVSSLKILGKKLVILSNTSSPSDWTLRRLGRIGFNRDDFIGAVTSGEEAGKYIQKNLPKKKAVLFFWDSKKDALQEFLKLCSDITICDSLDEADFLMLYGCEIVKLDGEVISLKQFHELGEFPIIDQILTKAGTRNLPMICANPDYVTILKDGSTLHMPGKIADRYKSMFNGKVTYFGKPHVSHFEACLRDLDLPKDRVVHVGDSLHHDIKGANAAGIDSIFITGGIHSKDLTSSTDPKEEELNHLFQKEGSHVPTHVVPMLVYE